MMLRLSGREMAYIVQQRCHSHNKRVRALTLSNIEGEFIDSLDMFPTMCRIIKSYITLLYLCIYF